MGTDFAVENRHVRNGRVSIAITMVHSLAAMLFALMLFLSGSSGAYAQNSITFSCNSGYSGQVCKAGGQVQCQSAEGNNVDNLNITGVNAGSIVTFTFNHADFATAPSTTIGIAGQGQTDDPTPTSITVPPNGQQSVATISATDAADGQADFRVQVNTNPSTGLKAAATYAVACVAQNASIDIQKDAIETAYDAVNNIIHYNFTVTNTGNVTLTNVSVSDPGATLSGCSAASLAPGASFNCTGTHSITQGDLDAGSFTNTATATGTPPVGDNVSDSDSATVTATQRSAIGIEKDAVTASYSQAGQILNYNIVVRNLGNVTLSPISVSDPDATLSGCNAASLAPGGVINCTATYVVTQADVDNGSFTNTATGTGTPPSGPDVSDTDDATVNAVRNAAIEIKKTATVTNFDEAGDILTYDIDVTNTGNVTLTNVFVTDPGTTLSGCSVASLGPGVTHSCTASYATVQADVNAGSFTNTATATGTPPAGPDVTDDDTAVVPVVVGPAISISKTATTSSYSAPNEVLTYDIVVTNTGNQTLASVFVSDPDATLVGCSAASMAPNASFSCTASHVVTQADVDAGSFTNTATATGTPPDGPDVTAQDDATVQAVQSAAITIVKSSSTPSYSNVNDVITYSLVVTNTGNVTLTNVSINDPGANVGACSSVALPGTLNPGQSTTCSATHSVVQADINAGSYTNTATASGTTPSQGTVVADPSSVTTPFVGQEPTISLTKVPNPTTYADAGETITYVYTVTNTGPIEVTALTLVDNVIGAISCPSTTLATGASVVCQATYVTTLNDVTNKCVKNTATATAQANGKTATATADAEVCLSNKKTRKIIRDFINRRVDLLASNEPDRARLMRRFNGTQAGSDGQAFAFSGSSGNGSTRMAFATSLSQIRAANAAKTQKKARELAEEQKKNGTGPFEGRMALGAGAAALGASKKDVPVFVPRSSLDIWFEAHYQKWSDDDDPRDGDFAIIYVGADYLVSPNFLVGVLVQFDHMSDANAALNSDVRGNGWMAGPYLSAKFGEHLYFDARGAWGTSTNDINPFGTYTDKFETIRWLAKANLTGKWMLGKMRFSPSVGVIYVEETQRAYTDSLGLLMPEQTARVGRLQFGPEFGYPIQMENGAVIEPHISATAMWDFEKTDGLTVTGLPIAQDDFRMKVEGGLIARSPDGYSMRATISYDGIGSDDFQAWGGQIWFNYPLN